MSAAARIDGAGASRTLGTSSLPILHLHPLRRCNLACVHCYSRSSPAAADCLPIDLLERALEAAWQVGFRALAISGGEPFLYRDLARLLEAGRRRGFHLTVATNGYFATRERMRQLKHGIDVLGFSLDGLGAAHNRVRGRETAFEKVQRGLDNAAEEGVEVALACGLRRSNWESLPEIFEFAISHSVRRLQFHPIELFGRAQTHARDEQLSAEDLCRIFIATNVVASSYACSIATQIDLLHRSWVLADPRLVYAEVAAEDHRSMASLLGTLVLEPDGTIAPVAYGFGRKYCLGNILEGELEQAWDRYRTGGLQALLALCDHEWREIRQPGYPDVFNWHERIVARSRRELDGHRRLANGRMT